MGKMKGGRTESMHTLPGCSLAVSKSMAAKLIHQKLRKAIYPLSSIRRFARGVESQV